MSLMGHFETKRTGLSYALVQSHVRSKADLGSNHGCAMMMHSDQDYSPAMPAIFVCLSRSNATPAICQHKCSHGFGAALIASETDRRLCRRPPSFSHSRGAIKVTFACISLSRANTPDRTCVFWRFSAS